MAQAQVVIMELLEVVIQVVVAEVVPINVEDYLLLVAMVDQV